MTEWLDIETAPKDGTPILAWDKNGYPYGYLCMYWEYDNWALLGHHNYESYDRSGFDSEFCPTHWKPLDPPPTN